MIRASYSLGTTLQMPGKREQMGKGTFLGGDGPKGVEKEKQNICLQTGPRWP